MRKKIMYDIGDIVTYQDSKIGVVVNVDVDEDNNTTYEVLFNNDGNKVMASFLAKDLDFVL